MPDQTDQFSWKQLVGRHKGTVGLSVALLACEAGSDLMQPTLMAQLINQGVLGRDPSALGFWGAWMLGFVGLGALCALGRNGLSAAVSQQFGAELRSQLFHRLLGLRFDQVRQWETAALLTRLTADVGQVQNLLNGLMRLYLKAPLLGAGALVLAFVSNPVLGLLVLPVFPLVGLLFLRQMGLTLPLFQRSQGLLDDLSARLRDFLHGIRVIKGFGREVQEREAFAGVNADLASVNTRTQTLQAAFSPLVTLTVSLVIVLGLAVGGLAPGGSPQVGQLMAFVQYLTQILFSLLVVSNLAGVFSRAKTSARRIAEVFAVVPRPPVQAGTAPVGTAVAFETVEFSYGGDPVLTGITFSLAPGQTLGVLGSTGSGKSTLLQLAQGFHEPSRGRVLMAPDTVVGSVLQNPLLFTGTLRANLLWGDPGASEAALEEVLEVADILEFVHSLPEGLETRLGPGGVNLSGGQKQRITLARTLLRRPTLLLLDEAFSALDHETEARVEARLARFLPSAAVIRVAQKVASVRSGPILVLENGRMEGWGPHGDLLRRSPVYRQICRSQGLEP